MLLKKAEVSIRLAMYALSTGDAYMYDLAIFHCQCALERLLKHILINFGEMSEDPGLFNTHNMAMLIGWVEAKTNFAVPPELKEMADDLTEWRISARYGDEHVGSHDTIVDLVRLYDEIRAELEERSYV